jgi:hypothetical protein
LAISASIIALSADCLAQELEPRAYSVSPIGTNFAVLGFSRAGGDISFDPSLPIEDAKAQLVTSFFAYGRSLGFLGRSANVSVTLPYVFGDLSGLIGGTPVQARRSGLANPAMRFSVNLYGAPEMNFENFAAYRQKTNIGASVTALAPLGQYDPARLVNIGTNRWAVKPEVGISQRVGRWYFDLYLGAWIFSSNGNYQGRVRAQSPIASSQFHVSYGFKPRLWVAFDGNYYIGGRTSINGIRAADLQRNSRIGGTISIPLTKRQSVKFTGSSGARTNIGGDFVSIGVAYQYLWGGGRL